MTARPDPHWTPRGLRLPDAARYAGLGRTKFLELVAQGRMPRPKRVDGCMIWDRRALDEAWDDLPDEPVAAAKAPSVYDAPAV